MVYLEGSRGPTYKHETYQSAATEAKRLAKIFERKAYVLATVKSFELVEFHEEELTPDMNELPF